MWNNLKFTPYFRMLKKIGIIGSGVAGVTLLKALVDQTLAKNSSKTNKLNLEIVLIERGRNFFDTFAGSPSSNPVVVIHNPVTSRTEYQFFCNRRYKNHVFMDCILGRKI